jgi:hypothetical protein
MKTPPPNAEMTDLQIEQTLHRSRGLTDAPEDVIQRALDLWQPRALPATQAPAGLLQRVLATLSFDSLATPALALGMRSGAADTQQLLFSAQGHDVDVRITALPPGAGPALWRISGQILGPESEGTAELLGGTSPSLEAWNEMGEFAFDAVPGGHWTLLLRTATLEIEAPAIVLPRP